MSNIDPSTISNTPEYMLRVLHALDLKRADVTDEQLDDLNAVLTEFAIDSIETAGGSIR